VQLNLIQQNKTTENHLSITISPQEVRAIEVEAEPIREKVRAMMAAYRPTLPGNGNGEGGKRTVEVEAESVEDLRPINSKEGSERPEFWRQFCGSLERPVAKDVAVFVAATIVNETVGKGIGNRAIVSFKTEPIVVSDVLAVIEKLCGGPAGFQHLQKLAGF
jgi:hypothetical protein